MDTVRLLWWGVVLVAALACEAVHAKDLVRVAIPAEDYHDPLYIDAHSIHWDGNVVQFRYVLDVPILKMAGAARRFKSNEIEAVIDCMRRTISIGDVATYSDRAATGDITSTYSATAAEQRPARIDMRRYSTNGYLYRHFCQRSNTDAEDTR